MSAQETVPIELTYGISQVPNVFNETAVDANAVSSGYILVNVTKSACGVSGTLKLNKEANVYGYDFDYLRFQAQYQADTRLSVHIEPTSGDDVFTLLSEWVPKPQGGNNSCSSFGFPDLLLRHSRVNESFWFEVVRTSTADVIFSTRNNPLVFANQFVQFNTSLPRGHVITGLGEAIHGFTNLPGTVRTLFANDVGDPIDGNIYGVHPFYVDHRFSNQTQTPDYNATFNITTYPGVNGTKVWPDYSNSSASNNGTISHNSTISYNSTVSYNNTLPKTGHVNSSWAHGVWWRTSAPQEIIIEEESLTWRALNGVVDLYFFLGPSPKDVIRQYVAEIGLPALQPYWALGYHQCKWGYSDLDELSEVVDQFRSTGLQLETIWSDIDYMDSYKDFTTDPYRYPEDDFQDFLSELHDNHQHYVPIVDAAIYHPNPNNKTDDNYTTFHEGVDQDVFLKNPDGSMYIGAVWPGYTVFPDFLAANISDYWSHQFITWHEKVPFDGIWLDMNEVSSFCVGSCGTGRFDTNPVHPPFAVGAKATEYPEGFQNSNSSEYSSIQSYISSVSAASATSSASSSMASGNSTFANSTTSVPASSTSTEKYWNTLATGKGNINYPPYVINNDQQGHDLAVHAVSPNATHQDGTLEYDIHNLYGFMQTKATYHALTEVFPNKRPFIISRSTFSGSGNYTGHWGGDNASKWAYAYFSIPQALSLGLLGVPFFGVDVCGFNGNTDYELCSRWMQLGSFFPFYRNHNVLGAIPQEPYRWEAVLTASKVTMDIRYALLPYYYTLMYIAHETGVPILRALLWEFPNDPALADVATQFFVGDALIITPVLEPNVSTVKGTFPGSGSSEVYYDWYTHQEQDFENGKNETLSAPLGHIPLHIRGGHVLPMQEAMMTTAECRNSSWSLLVALDLDGSALGSLYVDDGVSLDSDSLLVNFVASNGFLSGSSFGEYNVSQPMANITILGVLDEPSDVQFNDETVDFDFSNNTIYIKNLEDWTPDGAFATDFSLVWE